MITLKINNIKIKVEENSTVLQACNSVNIDIPKFCFHEDLEIDGNCRMCLVEIKNSIKPVASCAMPVMESMEVFTNTPLVKKARESVLEFMLINHPLDCPICDQGGECDLQDQALTFGGDKSRFFDAKKTVEDKNCGPFIKTIMTRCIQCSRCVRFANEVCNVDDLGMVGRGNNVEVSFFVNKIFKSEFSGNVIDLCPVGALTSKPFAFKTRSWELQKKVGFDILDSIGSPLVFNLLNNQINRVLPQKNWIPNRTRFFFDSLKYQRITEPLLITDNKNKSLSWDKTFKIFSDKLYAHDSSQFKIKIGNFTDLKTLFYLKQIFNNVGFGNFVYNNNEVIVPYYEYKKFDLNKSLSKSNSCLIIGLNIRANQPHVHLLLNRLTKRNNLNVFSAGQSLDQTYPISNIGISSRAVTSFLNGKNIICKRLIKGSTTILCDFKHFQIFSKHFKKFKNIDVILINNEMSFFNFSEIVNSSRKICNLNKCLTVLYNTDNTLDIKDSSYKIYFGHHFTSDAKKSNLIVPIPSFLEKKSLHLNNQGELLSLQKVVNPTKLTKSDSLILKNFSIYSCFKKLKNFNCLFSYVHNLKSRDQKKVHLSKYSFYKTRLLFNNSYYKKSTFYNNSILEKFSKNLSQAISSIGQQKNF